MALQRAMTLERAYHRGGACSGLALVLSRTN